MRRIRLKLKKRSYDIIVGCGIINRLGNCVHKLNIGADAYVITNPLIRIKFGKAIQGALSKSGMSVRFKTVADTEKSKSVETAARVLKDLAAYDLKKRIFIVALGGGVVGDLAGFVASIYKRGIPYIQVPTTLLAQVDSAIGGKTAIDLSTGKNLIGAIYQPKLVFSDVGFLKSLSLRQIRAGLAEVIKYGIIKNPGLFSFIEKNSSDILRCKPAALELIVQRCSKIKADVVSRDEKEESGLRTILNFGHTIGHAIETASGYNKFNHGEAVALGILIACGISRRLGLIKLPVEKRVGELIKKVGLPTQISGISIERIINTHYHDKKFLGKRNRFVLIKRIGITQITRDIPLKIIKDSIKERF